MNPLRTLRVFLLFPMLAGLAIGQTVAPGAAAARPLWPADGVFPGKGKVSSWTGFKARDLDRRTFFAGRRAFDQDGVVFVGDSITEGWSSLEQDWAGLGVKVVNRGIGGDTTPNLLYRLEEDVLSLHPRALVILIGTNDLGEHTPPADIADNLKTMLARIRAECPTIPIAWCLVMPRTGNDAFPARIHELNGRIRQLAAGDPGITLCDTFTPFALPDGTSKAQDFKPDHLHPNPAGYAVWRRVIAPVLFGWRLGVR